MPVVVGDARAIPLPSASVQCVVTSPPYYGLRDYGVEGQIGSEDSLAAFLATMVGVMREVGRVLRDDGTCFLNLGDSFAGAGYTRHHAQTALGAASRVPEGLGATKHRYVTGFRPKCKMLVPHRLAIALCDDGWIVRQDIVWAKPNPMPESTKDRPTTAHEFVFLLAKQPRYYYDAEAVREPLTTALHAPQNRKLDSSRNDCSRLGAVWGSEAGRNKRSVWHIPSHPFPDAHFATFPPALVQPCILAGTPQKACPTCGAGWVRQVTASGGTQGDWNAGRADTAVQGNATKTANPGTHYHTYRREVGGLLSDCDCPDNDGSGKALVLDPFAGSGTTGVVAKQMGREFFGVELNPEYAAMANARIREQGEGRTREVDAQGRVAEQLVMGL